MARESTIRVLRSTGSTDPAGLTFGELAYVGANGKLFMGTTAGESLWIGTGITTGGIATNSATLVPTQSAVKTYVDAAIGGSVVNTFNGTSGAISLTGSGAILYTQSGGTNTISARVATTGVTGVASFNSASFDVSAGDVTIKTSGVSNTQLLNSSVTVTAGNGLAGGGAVSLGGTITLTNAGVTGVVAGTGIAISGATGNVTITNNGVQSVNGVTGAIVSVGLTSGKLSQFAATTSAELAGVVSDETGSGALVFAAGPTFTGSINTSSASFNLLNTTATTLTIGSAATTGRIFGYTGTLAATQTVTVAGANTGSGANKTVNIGTGSGLNGSVTVNIGQKPDEGSGTINLLSNTAVTGTLTVSSNISAPNIVNSVNGATGAISLTGNGAILYSQSGSTNTISARVATTGVTGVASFSSTSFVVTAGEVTIANDGVSNAQLVNDFVTVTANGTSTLALGNTLTLTGGSNITLSNTANTVTLGLANDIVIAGNLTVNGTVVTANVDSFIAEDSMFALGTGNAADSLDIGFYGIYTNASQRSFTGLFRDASDSGKYKMYTGLTGAEPTTTVDTTAAGYAVATLVVNIDGGTF